MSSCACARPSRLAVCFLVVQYLLAQVATVELVVTAGSTLTAEVSCVFRGPCKGMGFSLSPLTEYSESPLLGKQSLLVDTKGGKYRVTYMLRSLDNMIDGREAIWVNWTQRADCRPEADADNQTTEECNKEVAVRVEASVPPASAWELLEKVSVPCLVAGISRKVTVKFGKASASLRRKYQPLRGSWAQGQELPWVLSRPSGATERSPGGTQSFNAESQEILQRLDALPAGDGLTLELLAERGGLGISWQVCFYPGDGYNWYAELCTEVAVRRTSQECADADKADEDGAPARCNDALVLAAVLLIGTWVK